MKIIVSCYFVQKLSLVLFLLHVSEYKKATAESNWADNKKLSFTSREAAIEFQLMVSAVCVTNALRYFTLLSNFTFQLFLHSLLFKHVIKWEFQLVVFMWTLNSVRLGVPCENLDLSGKKHVVSCETVVHMDLCFHFATSQIEDTVNMEKVW